MLQCNDVLFLGAQQRREGVFERVFLSIERETNAAVLLLAAKTLH